MALYAIEPWGEFRADLRSGVAAAALCNMWIAKGRRYQPADFVFETVKPPQTPEEQRAILRGIVAKEH